MNGSSNPRILRVAIAVSLAIHLIAASIVHPSAIEAQPEEKPGPLLVIKIQKPKPTPTPAPPKPQLEHPQHAAQPVRPPLHPPRQLSHSNPNVHQGQTRPVSEPSGTPNGPDVFASPGPAATGTEFTPGPTPKPACSAPEVPAKTVDAISPQAPADATNLPAIAKVKVDLDASGNLVGVSIYESTGSPQLDRAALEAARTSRYSPEEQNCHAIAGSYLFTVDFQE